MDMSKLITSDAAAHILGLKPDSLRAMRTCRNPKKARIEIPYYKVGRRVMYDPADVQEYLAKKPKKYTFPSVQG
jgi:hypothetical protein